MSDDQRAQLINQFIHTARHYGALNGQRDFAAEGYVIGFRKIVDDDGVSRDLVLADEDNSDDFDVTFPFPKLKSDELNNAVDLAGYLTNKLRDYETSRKRARGARATNAKLTPEQRSANARKAGRAGGRGRGKKA